MAQDELPQTYLITPADFDHTVFCDDLARILDTHPVACVRMALATRDETRILRSAMPCARYAMHETLPLLSTAMF